MLFKKIATILKRIFTKTNTMKLFIIAFLCFTLLFSCKENSSQTTTEESTQKTLSTAETIAYKAGLEKWDAVQEIHFTFNVDRGENHFERSWIWQPKSDDVQMISGKDTISFNRKTVDSIHKPYDASFINDKYWLLAPYNLVWDKGTTITEKDQVVAPISKDTLQMLTLTYGNEGGYTPGDAYDFYYSDDFTIREWTFRKGNQEAASMITTWEMYKNFNGLQIATVHQDSTQSFKLHFTGIEVK